jgi:hypothetical protein
MPLSSFSDSFRGAILGNMAMWWCAFFFILGYCTAS